mmetsp:Transcript_48785/g.106048  ORF Transcript_48785/g.106048 Transcript_48785/m.106048 type:complete len:253 (-) Transcript_48785:34-792(-)
MASLPATRGVPGAPASTAFVLRVRLLGLDSPWFSWQDDNGLTPPRGLRFSDYIFNRRHWLRNRLLGIGPSSFAFFDRRPQFGVHRLLRVEWFSGSCGRLKLLLNLHVRLASHSLLRLLRLWRNHLSSDALLGLLRLWRSHLHVGTTNVLFWPLRLLRNRLRIRVPGGGGWLKLLLPSSNVLYLHLSLGSHRLLWLLRLRSYLHVGTINILLRPLGRPGNLLLRIRLPGDALLKLLLLSISILLRGTLLGGAP